MKILLPLLFLFSTACYPKVEVEGFDQKAWKQSFISCNDSKVALAEILIEQQERLLGEGQAEIKQLLGQPQEHELYNRNQKFFYYALTPSDTCGSISKQLKLSVKFDAIDRAKELMIIE